MASGFVIMDYEAVALVLNIVSTSCCTEQLTW